MTSARRLLLAAAAALYATSAAAQIFAPPSAAQATDLSGYALLSQVPAPYTDAQAKAAVGNSFTNATCMTCTMTSPSMTGATNGGSPVTTAASLASALAAYQPAGSYLTPSAAAALYQPLGSYVTAGALSAAGYVTSGAITSGSVAPPLASVGNVSGVVYLHRYSNVSLTVPAISIGAIGTGTAAVSGTAAGDQCFVAPTAGTTALGYVMGAGWVTTAGTVKVTLAAGSLVAVSATTIAVNMLCAR